MSQAQALYRLQQIDLQLIRYKKRQGEIAEQLEDNAVVTTARQRVEGAEGALKPLRVRVRDLELEIESTVQKSKATEDRLYSGKVKNPKEMGEMQQEMEALKRRKDELEDALLEEMMAVEGAEDDLAETQQSLQAITVEWEAEHADLLAEQQQIAAEVEALLAKRERALENVTPESRKIYDSMRKRKANQPVALLQAGTCTTCGVEQTRAIEQEVAHGRSLVYCNNCGRILTDAV